MPDWSLVGVAVAAGLVAAVNPCGFALLPAYLTLFVGGAPSRSAGLGRALSATAALTLGFVVVFGAFGLAAAPAATWLQARLPWVAIVLGLFVTAAGAWVLAGRELPGLTMPRPGGRRIDGSFPTMALFGVAYALASLACTIAPFLAVVMASFRAGSTGQGMVLFLAYAVGMGLTVGFAAVAVALAHGAAVSGLRSVMPVLQRLGGLLLVVVGLYAAYHGWWERRMLTGSASLEDPLVTAGSAIQRRLADAVDAVGPSGFALALIALVAGAAAVVAVRETSTRPRHARAGDPSSRAEQP